MTPDELTLWIKEKYREWLNLYRQQRLLAIFAGILTLEVILLLIVLVFVGLVEIHNTANHLENTLVDMRIRAASWQREADKNIVVVALDQETVQYARNHPALGINSRQLPRKYLADVIRYISSQGAKAIILDIEFNSAKNPEDDAELNRVIREAGNVYMGTRADQSLKTFMAGEPKENRAAFFKITNFNQYLMPYILRETLLFQRLVPDSVYTPYSLGFKARFDMGHFFFKNPQDMDFVIQSIALAAPYQQPNVSPGLYFLNGTGTPWIRNEQEFFAHRCMTNRYYDLFLKMEKNFLTQLEKRGTQLVYDAKPSVEQENTFTYCQMGLILPEFLASAKGVGITSADDEGDPFIRDMPAIYRGFSGQFYTYLGYQPALDLLQTKKVAYHPNYLTLMGGANERTPLKKIPLIDEYKVLLNWRDPIRTVEQVIHSAVSGMPTEIRSDYERNLRFKYRQDIETTSPTKSNRLLGYGHLYRFVSVIDIIKRLHRPEEPARSLYNIYADASSGSYTFKDKIVIYGDTKVDVHRTPISNTIAGPEIVATALDMMLNDDTYVQKIDFSITFILVLLLCFIISYLVMRSQRLIIGFVEGALIITIYWVYNYTAFLYGYWAPLAHPTLLMFVFLTGVILYRHSIHDQERRQLTAAFSKYVSPQLMKEILVSPGQVADNLKGSKKELTVMFTDIHDFTRKFEGEDPEVMVSQLNEYFDVMTRIILEHEGTYDKYMGDSIMAFWGAPLEIEAHAWKACLAALKMDEALRTLNEKWRQEGRKTLEHGIGISTGEMFVGNFGSNQIKNFTVIGGAVNLGSRLEAHTRHVEASIVISEKTRQETKHVFNFQDLGKIQVKGFSEPVQAYGLSASAPHYPIND